MNSQRGFILSYLKYGDSDAIVHCYFRDIGYQSVFLKGLYTSRNKKKAYIFPLNEIEFTFQPIKSGKIITASKFELIKGNYDCGDINSSCMLMFCSDFLNQVLREENGNEEVYIEISNFLQSVACQNANAHLALLFSVLRYSGHLPLISSNAFLNPESGEFTENESHLFFSHSVSEIWKIYLESSNNYFQIQLNRLQRQQMLDSLIVYYHFHFSDFRTPNSIEIIKNLYTN